MARVHTVREHETLEVGDTLSADDLAELSVFAGKVLKLRNGDLAASNYVGIVTTSSGTVVEILPKIDLDDEAVRGHDRTREVFLNMLRRWRGLGTDLRSSDIRELSRFPMLEVFVRQFLYQVNDLIRHGLARRYVTVEENLPYLRGRIVFSRQVQKNAANQARFYVAHSELTVDRPANRLIRSTLERLVPRVQTSGNRQALREALIGMADVPQRPTFKLTGRGTMWIARCGTTGPLWIGLDCFCSTKASRRFRAPTETCRFCFRWSRCSRTL